MHAKIDSLREWFRPHRGAITAFSGGVDSGLVLFLSGQFLGDDAFGCISVSPSLKRRDYAEAVGFCREYGIRLTSVETGEVDDPRYAANPANRCWYCKSHLYRHLATLRDRHSGFVLLNGTNLDDLGDHRPGLRAAEEFGVRSPLAECRLTKRDVRDLANHFGLPNREKAASPCLSSRVPYGQAVTREKLKQVEAAEQVLDRFGFSEARVRHYGAEARIEVPVKQIPQLEELFPDIAPAIESHGFARCSIDAEGLVSGKLNRVLPRYRETPSRDRG
jgi:uncharacterized protein